MNASKTDGIHLAVGFFDGVHLGHQRILEGTDSVLTFSNHPLSVLDPSKAPSLLMDVDERILLLKTLGTKQPRDVHAFKFTKKFASMKPEDFAAFLRLEFPHLKKIHCGANWRFGADGVGTPKTLEEYGFSVKVSRFSKFDDRVISSTRIRSALGNGDVESANAMLGRCYAVTGQIRSGKHLGRELGTPTINLEVSSPLKHGVYAVDTQFGHGVANYGFAPTMGDRSWQIPVLEIHLLDRAETVDLDFGGAKNVRTEFIRFLRPEWKFDTAHALSRQIAADISTARSCF